MEYLFVGLGLIGLFLGGDWLVKGAIALSLKLGLPAFLISLTVVGFGTSMPELLVSARAALAGTPGIAVGNVIGSNIANILLILGVASLIAPMPATAGSSKRDLSVMLLGTFLLLILLRAGELSRLTGLIMFMGLVLYLLIAYFQDRDSDVDDLDMNAEQSSALMTGGLIIAGLAFLSVGADLLVRGATALATQFGVSNAVIGLTVVAIGTSLPELATSITAAFKRRSEIAIGNVIGSNIFNLLGILGITALITPIPIEERFVSVDGWILLAATATVFAALFMGKGIGRLMGGLFLVGYAGYMVSMA